MLGLAAAVETSGSRRMTGGDRIRARNALPRVFFICRKKPRMVHGVALVSACYTTSSGEHYVQFGGHCVLANPIEVGSCLRNNGTYSLQDDLELAARSSPTHEGGSLN